MWQIKAKNDLKMACRPCPLLANMTRWRTAEVPKLNVTVLTVRREGTLKQNFHTTFEVLMSGHFGTFVSVITQQYAQNFCFKISSFHACTCFEQMFSSSGDQN